MGRVKRQSRCQACNRVYGRRKSFVNGRLHKLAEQVGATIQRQDRSSYRGVELLSWPSPEAYETVVEAVRGFNAGLQEERCDVARHGIAVRCPVAPPETPTLFDIAAR